jgi:hypothetical protein
LKRAYKKEVRALTNSHINSINKLTFLAAFLVVHQSVFLSNNIKAGFGATGLVPLNAEMVLSKLKIKSQTPSSPLPINP